MHQSKFRSIRIVNPANMAANIAYEFPIMHCPPKSVTSLRPTPGIFSTRNGSKDKQSVVESLYDFIMRTVKKARVCLEPGNHSSFFARYSRITQQDSHTDTQQEEEAIETRPAMLF